jgi:hypothetical protein
MALNPSWIMIVSIRKRPIESLRGFLTEGRVETFILQTDFLDRATSGLMGDVFDTWGSRCTFYLGSFYLARGV